MTIGKCISLFPHLSFMGKAKKVAGFWLCCCCLGLISPTKSLISLMHPSHRIKLCSCIERVVMKLHKKPCPNHKSINDFYLRYCWCFLERIQEFPIEHISFWSSLKYIHKRCIEWIHSYLAWIVFITSHSKTFRNWCCGKVVEWCEDGKGREEIQFEWKFSWKV